MIVEATKNTLNKQGKITLMFTALVLLIMKFVYPEQHVLSWDVFGYYLYLPAKFIYHDPYLLNQDWLQQVIAKYESTATLYQINQHPETGHWIVKYSMGMSLLYAPFFFLAHFLAPVFGFKQDGFSAIYAIVIETGMFLISLAGLYFLIKLLFEYFESKIAILSFLLIVFASNHVQLSVQYSLLTHVPLFSLYAILLYYTLRWNRDFLWKHFFIIALCCGLITLIRPNEIVCILLPVLWNIGKKGNLKAKINFLYTSLPGFLLATLLFFGPFFIQMIYWKIGTGQWLYYSYQNPGEGFDFGSPHLYQFLFSFRKGWFIYTPLALFAILSLYYVYQKQRTIFIGILLPVVISVYLVSSWSCWWYAGGSYSQRAILSIYPLLSISLGFGLQYLFSKIGNYTLVPFALVMMLNLFQAWQFKEGILDHERMTFEQYKRIFFKTKKTNDSEKYLLVNRSADERDALPDFSMYREKLMVKNNYSIAPTGKEQFYCDSIGFDDSTSVVMDASNEFLDGMHQQYREITNADHFWIKVRATVFIPKDYKNESPHIVIHFNHGENGTYKYRNKFLINTELKKNEWNTLEYIYLSPEVRSAEDDFKVYLWHPAREKVYIDNYTVSVLIPQHHEN